MSDAARSQILSGIEGAFPAIGLTEPIGRLLNDSVDAMALLAVLAATLEFNDEAMLTSLSDARCSDISIAEFVETLASVPVPASPPTALTSATAVGRFCSLRDFTDADTAFLHRLAVHPDLRFHWRHRGAQIAASHVVDNANTALQFLVSDGHGRAAGYTVISDYTVLHGHASVSGVFDPSHHGTGLPIEALWLTVQYAFRVYPLRKVYAESTSLEIDQFRAAVNHGLMRQEGCLSGHLFVDGDYRDVFILAIDRDAAQQLGPQALDFWR